MLLPTVSRFKLLQGQQPVNLNGLPTRFMNPGELEVLIALMRGVSPKHVVEFGCNNGRTAKAMLDNVPSIEEYTGVEVPKDYRPSKQVQLREWQEPGILASSDPRFELMLRPRGSLDLSDADFPNLADVFFIDGDHSSGAVIHDTFLATSRIRPGGMIIWHDYHELGTVDVQEVLDILYQRGRHGLKHVEGTWIVYECFPKGGVDDPQ